MLKEIVLQEGIDHIEDLSVAQFINSVESLPDKIITEKLDGAQLWFGLDEIGLFTSREGKSPRKSRCYKVSDWPVVANYNAFRAAHLVIKKSETIIRKCLVEGDIIEVEVLYGKQPNTVTYGADDKNFIIILRGINATSGERVAKLSSALNHQEYAVSSTVVQSSDGEELSKKDIKSSWEFTNVTPIKKEKVETEVTKMLNKLKKYLGETNKVLGKSNLYVANLNLTSVPKDDRPAAKAEREVVNVYIMDNFKLPIKELLLHHFVRKIKPMLQSDEVEKEEDLGIEGVVVSDPITGNMTKIVDKDMFTAINTFNNEIRSLASGLTRTINPDAPIELRGGAFGDARIKIAGLLGDKNLALTSGTKRIVSKFKSNNINETAMALANHLNISSPSRLRNQIISILEDAMGQVESLLNNFKQNAKEYKLTLKTGEEIGMSAEVMKRNLTAFAETKQDMKDVIAQVRKATTGADLIIALYGKTIESIFNGEEMKESFEFMREDDGSDTSTTSSVDVTTLPKLINGRLIVRRKRTMNAPKAFTINTGMTEDAKFATDVDDSVTGRTDDNFRNLRNNLNIDKNVTTMDVQRYLDKAHEINDMVDTVIFGLETDDGGITKVYVNAAQADEFEKALADSLCDDRNIEDIINNLASQFDIVDVEVVGIANITPQDAGDAFSDEDDIDNNLYGEDGNPMSFDDEVKDDSLDGFDDSKIDSEKPEDTDKETDKSGKKDKSDSEDKPKKDDSDEDTDSEDKPKKDDSDEDTDSDENADDVDSKDKSDDEDNDRDEFGQIKKKLKKKKTEESIKMLVKDILAEGVRSNWVFAVLPGIGLQLANPTLDLKLIDEDEAFKLAYVINDGMSVTIHDNHGEQYRFEPSKEGSVIVFQKDKPTETCILTTDDIERLSRILKIK